jgi:polysaccharide pyruvyl transferase WcaK-like protein
MNSFFKQVAKVLDPDKGLETVMGSLIETAAMRHALNLTPQLWESGQPLKLLLAGYVGTRNTGADVRVEEMIRQIRHVLGDDQVELTIMSVDRGLSAGYFRTVRQVELPTVFPGFLFTECPKHHGVVACEGSMFKSKFSSALTCMMSGALGMANAEGKLSVGYGAEAGAMNSSLQSFVRKHCRDSLVICRNKPSRQVLGNLGIRTTAGTDTAWTFDPAPLEVGHELLTQAGWDGQTPLLAVCPINPFWWPVKPDLVKAAANKIAGQYKGEHYKSIYFHQYSEEKKAKNRAYLAGIAQAVNAFAGEQKVFPILVGMEQLDRLACESLQPLLDMEAPLFISDTYDMYQMVSVLRNCAMMVSSRFHAIVTSMPGLVASAGVTMDERIRNLMNDRNHPELFLEVDDEDLGDKLLEILRRLYRDREQIADDIGRVIPQQLELMGQMGIDFEDEVLRVYPEFERRNVPRSWEHYLPELPPTIDALMEKYG